MYKSKHYLLQPIKEPISLFKTEKEPCPITYYCMQKILKNEKHFFHVGDDHDDNFLCEKCKNVEL